MSAEFRSRPGSAKNSDNHQAEWRSLVRKFRPRVDLIRQPAEGVLEASNRGLQELLHDAFEKMRSQRIEKLDLNGIRLVLADWFDLSLQQEIPKGVKFQRGRFGLYCRTDPDANIMLPLQAAVLDKKYGLSDGRTRKPKEVASELKIKDASVNGAIMIGVQRVTVNPDIRGLLRFK